MRQSYHSTSHPHHATNYMHTPCRRQHSCFQQHGILPRESENMEEGVVVICCIHDWKRRLRGGRFSRFSSFALFSISTAVASDGHRTKKHHRLQSHEDQDLLHTGSKSMATLHLLLGCIRYLGRSYMSHGTPTSPWTLPFLSTLAPQGALATNQGGMCLRWPCYCG